MANKQYVKQSRLQIRTLSHRFFGLFRKKIQAFVRLMFRYKCKAVGTEAPPHNLANQLTLYQNIRMSWRHSDILFDITTPLGFSNLPTALISVQSSRTLQFHGWNMILESSNISKYSIDFRVDMMIKWFLFVIVFCDHICILNTHWPDFWIYLRLISCQSKIVKPFFIRAPSLKYLNFLHPKGDSYRKSVAGNTLL